MANNKQPAKAWLHITAGQGPKECGWVVAQLSRVLLKAAARASLHAEVVESLAYDKALRSQARIEPDALSSVLIRLEGQGLEQFYPSWVGTIKWQGASPYRPKHRRTNWFVGVVELSVPQASSTTLDALSKEVGMETMRSGGPGGQHVNKTNSAVRLTHRPTGLVVKVESDRSQHRNKHIALERLQLLLANQHSVTQQSHERDRWLQHYQVQRGCPVKTFYGKHFNE